MKTVALTPETNLAYVHVPRTGGEWVKSVFRKIIDSEISNFSLNIKSLDPTIIEGIPWNVEQRNLPRRPELDIVGRDRPQSRGRTPQSQSHLPMDINLIELMGYPSRYEQQCSEALRKVLSDQEKLETIRFASIRNPYDMLSSVFFRCATFPTWRGFRQFCLNFISPQPRWHCSSEIRRCRNFFKERGDVTDDWAPVRHREWDVINACKPFGMPADKFLFWWLFDKDGYPTVDFVIRNEKLTTGIRELLNVAVIPKSIHAGEMMLGECRQAARGRAWPGTSTAMEMIKEDMRTRLLTGNDANSSRLGTSEQLYMFSENSAKPFDDPVRQVIDERFSRECEAFNYDFVGPKDDHTFLDISGLRYHAEEDRLEVLYPIGPCEIAWKES